MTWKDKFSFGKYKEIDKTLLAVFITDKNYIKWCIEEGLYNKFPEIKFILDEMKPHERKSMGVKE